MSFTNGALTGLQGDGARAGGAMTSAEDPGAGDTWEAVEAYFECITTCSLEDGECVTRCVEELRERA